MRPGRARRYPDCTLANIDIHVAKKEKAGCEETSSFDYGTRYDSAGALLHFFALRALARALKFSTS